MKSIVITLIALAVMLTGCAGNQQQLVAANQKIIALQREHDLDAAKMQEVRAEASKDSELCMKFIGAARQAEAKVVELAGEAYDGATPVIIAKINQVWTEGVPAVEAYAHKAYDAAVKEAKSLAKDASK